MIPVTRTGTAPAPMPCRTRPARSSGKVGAAAASSDPAANTTTPTRSGVRRPATSATRPKTAVATEIPSENTASTQAAPPTSRPNSSRTVGSATATADEPRIVRATSPPSSTAVRSAGTAGRPARGRGRAGSVSATWGYRPARATGA